VLLAEQVIARDLGRAPRVKAADVHVPLDGEGDPVAADEAVALVVQAVVMAGQLVVGGVQELIALVLVLADEGDVGLAEVQRLFHEFHHHVRKVS